MNVTLGCSTLGFFAFNSLCRTETIHQSVKWTRSSTALRLSPSLARCDPLGLGHGLWSVHTLVVVPAVLQLLQPWHTGAAHRDGDIDLSVGVAASYTGTRPPQDDGGSVDGDAAVPVALLPVRSHQTALTQAVGLRDVAGEPAGVIGEPGKRKLAFYIDDCVHSFQLQLTPNAEIRQLFHLTIPLVLASFIICSVSAFSNDLVCFS